MFPELGKLLRMTCVWFFPIQCYCDIGEKISQGQDAMLFGSKYQFWTEKAEKRNETQNSVFLEKALKAIYQD